jgi:hypothetical protein
MKVLIYSRQDHGIIKRVEQVVAAVGNIHLEYARDKKEFKEASASCFAGQTLVVFFVDGENDMGFLESVEMDFMDTKLVIYFAEHKADLLARAYKLYPRVVTGAFDSDERLPGAVKGILVNLMGARAIIDD